jgi:protein involved in polysaccharide export with SLBB domain
VKSGIKYIAVFFLALSGFVADVAAEGLDSFKAYKLDSGDKISITVFDEPDLGLQVQISNASTISYPFLGELKVKGLTPGELESRITQGLKGPYLIDPKVSVTVQEYRPFYINGEVKQSGGYPFQPGLTLRRAVSLAGGFTERASKTKMTVIRDMDPEKKSVNIGLDDWVYPGDAVTIEQSFF